MSAPPPVDSVRDHLALALVPNLGPKRTAALLARFGSPAAIMRATAAELIGLADIGPKLAATVAEAFRTIDVDAELALLARHGVRPVPLGDPAYPARLADVPNAPPLLYLKGELLPADANAVGIVGSRTCTSYGIRTAERIADGLARAGWTVISGLARGIDAAAHRGALAGGGRTVAVLAGGLSRIYPPEHAGLADEVVRAGCLMTETPMTVEPQPGMFPARNRIISGLSRAVLVVEANHKSGALITVSHAADQGRDVYAVPGPVDSPASAGCLQLIRDGVRMVRDASDILEDLQGLRASATAAPDRRAERRQASGERATHPTPDGVRLAPPPLSAELQPVWDALAEPRHADELARACNRPAGDLARLLMQLELMKRIRRLPGNRFERA